MVLSLLIIGGLLAGLLYIMMNLAK